MSLAKLYYVICDVCGTPGSKPLDESRKARNAIRKTWIREADCDICPSCRRLGWAASEHWPDGVLRRLRRQFRPMPEAQLENRPEGQI